VLRKATQLAGCTIHATDGDIGSVNTIYFDDGHWTVRYFVVDTGKWLPGRKVLISPIAIRQLNWDGWTLDVILTREQVRNSPDIDTDLPVSRQHELDYYRYYGYPHYWGGAALASGAYVAPGARTDEARGMAEIRALEQEGKSHDPHLRDVRAVNGYHIRAADGDIGHVEDFLLDDQTWRIRYLVIDTSNWLGGRRVLVAPAWVAAVSWAESKVHLLISRRAVKESPEYDATATVSRDYERALYSHYGYTGYWLDRDVDRNRDDVHKPAVADRFARLEDLRELEVAEGEPDVEGWNVVASDGPFVGRVEHLIVDRLAMKVRYLEVGLEDLVDEERDPRDVLIPVDYVNLDEPRQLVRIRTIPSVRIAGLPTFGGFPLEPEYEQRLETHFGVRTSGDAGRDIRVDYFAGTRQHGSSRPFARERSVSEPPNARHDVSRKPSRQRGQRRDANKPARKR
jgi:sporulation protein YlmC with PRC-barrel domain